MQKQVMDTQVNQSVNKPTNNMHKKLHIRNYKHACNIKNVARNSIGQRLVLTSFGESHGESIGAILDGCPAGLNLSESDIQPMLDRRKPGQSVITTQRKENDTVKIISGTYRKYTTGAPITMIIRNADQRSSDYENLQTHMRPGHSDYTAMMKYNKHNDHRGGGRFSGRLTATHVMGGAIAKKLLDETLHIKTYSFVQQIGKISITEKKAEKLFTTYDHNNNDDKLDAAIYGNDVRCPDSETAKRMKKSILDVKRQGDSLGGIIKSITKGLPIGLGEPMFGSLESDISAAIFSIPSVKGVEFGSGFAGAKTKGSKNNDTFKIAKDQKNVKKIITRTNNSGGILGGISNGMPITMQIAFKPASSISQEQKTVNIKTLTDDTLQIRGRHDPCVVPRAPPIVDALVSLVIADHAIVSGHIKQAL